MKKHLFIIIVFLFSSGAYSQSEAVPEAGSSINTGLSIAFIVILGLVVYVVIKKSKLHKENAQLHKELKELKKK